MAQQFVGTLAGLKIFSPYPLVLEELDSFSAILLELFSGFRIRSSSLPIAALANSPILNE
jgi:hypothetical protein